MKGPKDNIGEHLHELGADKDFLDRMQKALTIKKKNW